MDKIFLVIFFLLSFYPTLSSAESREGVYSSKSLQEMSSRQWIEPLVEQVVYDAYQRFVRRVLEQMVAQSAPSMVSPMVEQAFQQAVVKVLELPDVMDTIHDVYAIGIDEAVKQLKKKSTQSVLQKEVENLVTRAMSRLARYSSFQQVVEQQISWAQNIQTHRQMQQAQQQQQRNTLQQQMAQQQAMQQMQQQFQERLQKAIAGNKR